MTLFRPGAWFTGFALLVVAGCGEQDRATNDRSLSRQVLQVNPAPDPRVMAWAGCLDSVTQCMEAGGQVRTCTTVKACGADCVTALDRALVGASGLEAELDAFESVFINSGAVCRPVEGGAG